METFKGEMIYGLNSKLEYGFTIWNKHRTMCVYIPREDIDIVIKELQDAKKALDKSPVM